MWGCILIWLCFAVKQGTAKTGEIPCSSTGFQYRMFPMRAAEVSATRSRAKSLAEAIKGREELAAVLDRVPDLIVVLNEDRRIVYANKAMMESVACTDFETIAGMLLGEVVGCRHALSGTEVCGTTDCCMVCGALRAMLEAKKGNIANEECRILRADGEAIDVRVSGSPYEVAGHSLVFLALNDISDDKRRRLLERIFFHDLLNSAGSIYSISEILLNTDERDVSKFREVLHQLSMGLVDEIKSQQLLTAAETGELSVNKEPLNVVALGRSVAGTYRGHEVMAGKRVNLDFPEDPVWVHSDPALVRRVWSNMLKNALEASSAGDSVQIGIEVLKYANRIRLWVDNPAFMPRHVQLQIFNRSFSTKGEGRGLGTYSIKLLGEKFLGGEVGFASDPGLGTRFFLTLDLTTPA
jgi:PAS domain-containing protein